ncbi:MAG TPA: hypothetical protein VK783_00050 [Bacteroidia bacterium]|nr:hypothetical protein [Bacteroidia bacterium]
MKRLPQLTIILIVFFCFLHDKHDRWSKDYGAWTTVINSDGYGYCAYLPAIVLHHNLDFKNALHAVTKVRTGLSDTYADMYILGSNDKEQLNKCFVGIAVMLLPFFLIACVFAKLFGYDVDGFSYPFQIGVSIAALFYLFVGLWYIYKLLKLYNVKEVLICGILLTVAFATNLFYYTTMEPSMPHIYDFSLVAVFMYYAKRSIDSIQLKSLLMMALSLGILIIIRPTNALVVLVIPFIAGSFKSTSNYIRSIVTSKQTVIAALLLFAIVSLQFIMWHAQTGHWYVWSYPGEGFNFKHPHFTDILFSYRKGWFVYTPIMFFMVLVPLIIFLRKDMFRFFSLLALFVIITYIFSSWWSWSYGGSFGSRPFVDYYPFFCLAFGISMGFINSGWYKFAGIVIAVLCMKLNLTQTRQYESLILPVDGMTKASYWKIFMKTDPEYICWFEPKDISKDFDFMEKYTVSNDFENNTWGPKTNTNITYAYSRSGLRSTFANKTLPFTAGYVDTVCNMPVTQPGKLSVFSEFWIYMPYKDNDAKLIVSLQQGDQAAYFWNVVSLPELVDSCNTWTRIQSSAVLPSFQNKNDIMKVMVMNTQGIVYVDDFVVKFGIHK